jgi:hypothetical protein
MCHIASGKNLPSLQVCVCVYVGSPTQNMPCLKSLVFIVVQTRHSLDKDHETKLASNIDDVKWLWRLVLKQAVEQDQPTGTCVAQLLVVS